MKKTFYSDLSTLTRSLIALIPLALCAIMIAGCTLWSDIEDIRDQAGRPPLLTGTVSINGSARVEARLTANTDLLDGSGTFSYKWKRGDSPDSVKEEIAGATENRYVLQRDDLDKYITVTVSCSGNRGEITSAPTSKVNPPLLTGSVSITGDPYLGETLTADTSGLNGSGEISYQWKRGSGEIVSETDTYTLQTDDINSTITVTVTRSGYSGSVSRSTDIITDNNHPPLTGEVSIIGKAIVGETLEADTQFLGGEGDIFYQWKRGSGEIVSETDTYTLQTKDLDLTITLTVARSGYSGSVSRSTDIITDNNLPPLTGEVVIKGDPYVRETLEADTSLLEGEGDIFYQWKREDAESFVEEEIPNAIDSTYVLQSDDLKNYITVTVTRSGNSGSITSDPTDQVNLRLLPGIITIGGDIDGIYYTGSILSAVYNGDIDKETLTYQWYYESKPLNQVTTPKYKVENPGTYYVIVGTDGHNAKNSENVVVIDRPILQGQITIKGTAKVGQTLTANTDLTNASGVFYYQWKRGGTPGSINEEIPDGIDSTFDLTYDDYEKYITVTVSHSIYSGSIISDPTAKVTYEATSNLAFSLINSNTEYSVSKGTATDTEVVIPPIHEGIPVTMIQGNGFADYIAMTKVMIPPSVISIGVGAFSGSGILANITDGVIYADKWAIEYDHLKEEIQFKDNTIGIGPSAFHGINNLTRITIPESVKYINGSAFNGCTKLNSINIPGSVTDISFQMCAYCESLTEVIIQNGVKTIEEQAFIGCTSLKSIVIPDSITNIIVRAFEGCNSLGLGSGSVFYGGTEAPNWSIIVNNFGNGNAPFMNANFYYYSEEQPGSANTYWHFNADGKPEIWK